MRATQRIASPVIAPAVLITALLAPAVIAQEKETALDRRVLVWRTEGAQSVDLETIGGHRGFLGVGLVDLTPELRDHFGVPRDRGVMVSRVVADSPAERAGLEPADILTAVDGAALPESIDLSMRLAHTDQGAEIELERWREGRRELLRIAIETRIRAQLDISPLIVRRIELEPGRLGRAGRLVEVESEDNVDLDHHWVKKVVETVGDSFSEATFVEQLEALRRERNDLLEHLRSMEVRLEQLESELHLLDSHRP